MTLVKSPTEIVDAIEASGSPGLLSRHESWERRPISDLCEIQNGAPFSSKKFNSDGNGFPLIRIRDVGRNQTATWFSGQFDDSYIVNPGDLLIGMDGDFRISRWHGIPALLNQRVCRLFVTSDALLDSFVEHVLQGYLDAIWSETSSVTVKHLSSRTVGQIPIPVPPIEEQRRIVEILDEQLSRLDTALESVRLVREKAAQFRRSLLHAAFSGVFSDNYVVNGHIPEGWARGTLGDAAEITMGQSPPGASYNEIGRGDPFFQGKAEFGKRHPTVRRWTTAGTRFAAKGDILMSVRAPVGPTNVADIDCVIGRGLAGIRARGHVDQSFLLWALRHFEHEIAAKGTGTTFDSISGNDLRSQQLEVPPIAEQEQIVEVLERQVSRVDAALAVADAIETSSTELRRSLLHAAFTGELTASWRNSR